MEETANLPEPDVLAEEMLEDLEAAVGLLREIVEDLAPDDFLIGDTDN